MSTQQRYRIVFRGQVLPGREVEDVRERASSRLRLSAEQIDKIFSGRTIYLKRRLDTDATKAYVKELLYVGLQVRIEREDVAAGAIPQAEPAVEVSAEFDPTRTELFTPTQLDNALARFASDYDSSSTMHAGSSAEAMEPAPAPPIHIPKYSDTPSGRAQIPPPQRLAELINIAQAAAEKDRPPVAKPRKPPSLAREYAKQRRSTDEPAQPRTSRTSPVLMIGMGVGMFVLGWFFSAEQKACSHINANQITRAVQGK